MRALVITHGGIGEQLVKVSEMILGPQEGLEAATNAGRSAEALQELVAGWLDAGPGPALVLIDDYGGSCATAAQLVCGEREDCFIVGGVNLAMVLGFLTWRETSEPEELVQRIVNKGREAIVRLGGA
jgi:mannose/fructose-specific phosphotransferase system component IIA